MTTRYEVPWYHDIERLGDDSDPNAWTIQDYTLARALGVDNNYEAEKLVADELQRTDQSLAERITFDSEHGCFFAYATSEGDITELARIINALVAAGGFEGKPGTILDSPAFLRLRT